MPLEIVTMQDLAAFKQIILSEVRDLLCREGTGEERMLKSAEVCRMLRISTGTLQNLRKNKSIAASKIGGTYYYLRDDIIRMLPKKK